MLLFELFDKEKDFPVYNVFWRTREMTLEVKGVENLFQTIGLKMMKNV